MAAVPDGTAPTAYELSGTTHTHLMSIAALLAALGFIFCFSPLRPGAVAVVVVVGYLGLLADVAGWWWATRSETGAVLSVVGGAVMGVTIAFMSLWSLGSLWFVRRKSED